MTLPKKQKLCLQSTDEIQTVVLRDFLKNSQDYFSRPMIFFRFRLGHSSHQSNNRNIIPPSWLNISSSSPVSPFFYY